MYLSRIQLNRQRRDAWRLLGSPQRLHAAVLASFLDPPTGALDGDPRVLWRLDHEANGRLFLYVVSPDRPDLVHLAEQAGWPSADRGGSKDYGPFLARLEAGQRWAFRLTANPTRYRRTADDRRAKRVAHVTVAQQESWLAERAETYGFQILGTMNGNCSPQLVVTRRNIQQFDRRGTEKPVTLGVAQFDGLMDVTDPEALRRALVGGIGPAKAYGCGLMTLARPE